VQGLCFSVDPLSVAIYLCKRVVIFFPGADLHVLATSIQCLKWMDVGIIIVVIIIIIIAVLNWFRLLIVFSSGNVFFGFLVFIPLYYLIALFIIFLHSASYCCSDVFRLT
jgi:hypothetical protein